MSKNLTELLYKVLAKTNNNQMVNIPVWIPKWETVWLFACVGPCNAAEFSLPETQMNTKHAIG